MACHSLDIPFLKNIFLLWRHLFFLILQTSYKRVRPCRSSCLYSRYTKHWFYQFFLIRLWDLNLLFRNMKWKLKLCLGKFLCSIYLYRYKEVANEPWRNIESLFPWENTQNCCFTLFQNMVNNWFHTNHWEMLVLKIPL